MRLKTQKAKKDNKRYRYLALFAVLAFIAGAVVGRAEAHAPGCHTHKCDTWADHQWMKHHPFTGYVIRGRISTFGYLTADGSQGQTADGGTTRRPCIAIRNDATLDHVFLVEIGIHRAKLLQCDWGPAESTGRSIDITGLGDEKLGLSITNFPTDSIAIARELR